MAGLSQQQLQQYNSQGGNPAGTALNYVGGKVIPGYNGSAFQKALSTDPAGAALSWLGHTFGPEDVKGPGNAPTGAPQGPLVFDPVSGLYRDPTTGTSYTNPDGTGGVHNPNAATLLAGNAATGAGLLNTLGGYADREANTYGQQQGLADSYKRTINDPNAPSVAHMQLVQGLGNIANEQQSMASGHSGEGGALARTNAAANIARAQVGANQTAALQRAKEVADAQTGLGATLGSMNNESQGIYGTNLGAAHGFESLAQTAATAKEKQAVDANIADADAKNKRFDKTVGGIGGALMSLL